MLSLLADGMTYYSCHNFIIQFCGPRGIRTLDLLNAIETRSQLRYGPWTILDFRFQIYDLDWGFIVNPKSLIVNLWT